MCRSMGSPVTTCCNDLQAAGGSDLVAPGQPLPNAAAPSAASADLHGEMAATAPTDSDDVPPSYTPDVAAR